MVSKKITVTMLCCIMIIPSYAICWSFNSLKKILSPFSQKTEQQIAREKYTLDYNSTVSIENIKGNILVKYDWEKKQVYLEITQKTPNKEMLKRLPCNIVNKPRLLRITPLNKDQTKGSIDYTLIVPYNTTLNLVTGKGNIKVLQANGPLCAVTHTGNIHVCNTKNTVVATAKNRGSIHVEQAQENVKATTNKGKISIIDAQNNILAATKRGNIDLTNSRINPMSTIKLVTQQGTIQVKIPQNSNADIYANAHRGTISSQHYVTLKPRTTKLDSKTWKELQKTIEGTIGTGEAQIKLTSNRGNIKIKQLKQS